MLEKLVGAFCLQPRQNREREYLCCADSSYTSCGKTDAISIAGASMSFASSKSKPFSCKRKAIKKILASRLVDESESEHALKGERILLTK